MSQTKRFKSITADNLREMWRKEAELLVELGLKSVTAPISYKTFVKKQESLYDEWFPELKVKAEEYARILNTDVELMMAILMTEHISSSHKEDPGCSVIILKNNTSTIIGRNYDGKVLHEETGLCVAYKVNGLNFWINTDLNAIKSSDNKNSFRIRPQEAWTNNFYIAINSGPSLKSVSGISATQVLEKVMLMKVSGATYSEITKFVEKVPVNRGMSITVVSDKTMVIVEKDTQKSETRKGLKKLWATNHFVGQTMLRNNSILFEKIPFHASFPRYGFIEANIDLLDADILSILDLLKKSPLNQNFRDEHYNCVTGWITVIKLGSKSKTVFSPNNSEFREELLLEYV